MSFCTRDAVAGTSSPADKISIRPYNVIPIALDEAPVARFVLFVNARKVDVVKAVWITVFGVLGVLSVSVVLPTAAKSAPSFDSVLQDGVVGALNYLFDQQADCSSRISKDQYICNRDQEGEMRINGGWDSYIEPAFKLFGTRVRSPIKFLDSNMFTTAAVLYPLWLIDLKAIPEFQHEKSIQLAMDNLQVHRRGEGYSFWANLGPSLGTIDRIGPLNLDAVLLGSQVKLASRIKQATRLNFMPADVKWLDVAFAKENDKLGLDVLFDVPSDTDDTALAIASRYFYHQDRILEGTGSSIQEEVAGLRSAIDLGSAINRYTDIYSNRKGRHYNETIRECRELVARNGTEGLFKDISAMDHCSLDDPREKWKYDAYREQASYTGSYMTWLYDEQPPTYADPDGGVILTGQNSVDCVVTANALFAISLSGLKDKPEYRPAYEASCNAITNVILDEKGNIRRRNSGRIDGRDDDAVWRYCGLFYPAHMVFPYKLSRAVRDGGACKDLSDSAEQTRFNQAMGALMQELADEQKHGEWYETLDKTRELPTALGVVTLLNFGQEVAKIAGISNSELSDRIRMGLMSLHRMKQSHGRRGGLPVYSLQAGTFFGGGTVNEIALWKSAPFATAIFLEASIKYMMGYDQLEHLAKTSSNREKLVLSNLRTEQGFAAFSRDVRVIDDGAFKRTYLDSAVGEPVQGDTMPVPDRLAPPEQSRVGIELESGIEMNQGSVYGVVGIELEVGERFDGGKPQAAYYVVKMAAQGSVNVKDPSDMRYYLQASFLGISSESPQVSDEVGFIPVVLIKEDDMIGLDAHLLHAGAELPILALSKNVRMDLSLAGKLLGYAYKRSDQKSRIISQGFAPGEVELGIVIRYKDLASFDLSGGAGLNLMVERTRSAEQFRAMAPLKGKLGASANITENLKLYLQYSYLRDRVLYPDGEHTVSFGVTGTFSGKKKKRTPRLQFR